MPRKGESHTPAARKKISAARRRYLRDPKARELIGNARTRETIDRYSSYQGEITHKRCSKCGETKPITDFYVRRVTLSSGLVVVRPEAACRQCCRARAKAYQERLRAEGVDTRALQRERYAKRSDAQKRRTREAGREWAAAKRRAEGVPVRGAYRRKQERPRLPVMPIREFLLQRLESESKATIAARTGLDERRLLAIEQESEWVDMATVDLLLTGLDLPEEMNNLYPVQTEPEMAAYRALNLDAISVPCGDRVPP